MFEQKKKYKEITQTQLSKFHIVSVVSKSLVKLRDDELGNCCVIHVNMREDANSVIILLKKGYVNESSLNTLEDIISRKNFRLHQIFVCEQRIINEFNKQVFVKENVVDQSASDRLINSIIDDGLEFGASDVHIQLYYQRGFTLIKFRINGIITPYKSIELEMGQTLLRALFGKSQGSENKGNQLDMNRESAFRCTVGRGKHPIRVENAPNALGFKSIWRIFPPASFKSYQELGYNKSVCDALKRLSYLKSGAMIFTGPVGSGKTTSLYAHINTVASNLTDSGGNLTKVISSIEDPVEMVLEDADQRSVSGNVKYIEGVDQSETELNTALSSLLRSNFDYLFLGEIRKYPAAKIMEDIGEIGHMAYGTMHAVTHAAAIRRLKRKFNFDNDFISVNGSLKGIMAQALVPRLCDDCKVPFSDVSEANITSDIKFYLDEYLESYDTLFIHNKNSSCQRCKGTGLTGRTLVYELFAPSVNQKKAIELYKQNRIVEGSEAFMNSNRTNGYDGITIGEVTLDKAINGEICAFDAAISIASLPISDVRKVDNSNLSSVNKSVCREVG